MRDWKVRPVSQLMALILILSFSVPANHLSFPLPFMLSFPERLLENVI